MATIRPVVGNWYQETEQGSIFEVVAYDEEEQTVEIQHLDGEVEEYDLDTWRDMTITGIEPPEDWRSGFELAQEDAELADEPRHPEDWSGALNQIEPDDIGIEDDWVE
ncbi:MAG: hypothetical protein IPF57_23230 [Gammaproteobacteria bacterium]|nr:hypothetical protein [Gammaproteobacteria bacterium]MBP6482740.1 hypothetical protein [Pseudomonadales bacterium]